MYKIILTLLMALAPIYSSAASVYYGLYTDHAVRGQFNELNKVVIAQFDSGFTVGSMVNSYGKDSTMFGYVQNNDKPLRFGVLLATGYKPENMHIDHIIKHTPLIPLPLASASLPITDGMSLTVNYIAGIVLNAGIEFSF